MKDITTTPAFAIASFAMGLLSLLLDLSLEGYLVAFILGVIAGIAILLFIIRSLRLPIGR